MGAAYRTARSFRWPGCGRSRGDHQDYGVRNAPRSPVGSSSDVVAHCSFGAADALADCYPDAESVARLDLDGRFTAADEEWVATTMLATPGGDRPSRDGCVPAGATATRPGRAARSEIRVRSPGFGRYVDELTEGKSRGDRPVDPADSRPSAALVERDGGRVVFDHIEHRPPSQPCRLVGGPLQ